MERGLKGLDDRDRSGRPRELDHSAIVAATLPKKLGVTHWSTRLLGQHLGIGNASVARSWRAYGVKPWKAESFRFPTDPELVGKVADICGLYVGTNEDIHANAIVISVDEKSQIQALDRPSRSCRCCRARSNDARTTTTDAAPRPCSRR